jgi:lysophospholipase L1-like esterase
MSKFDYSKTKEFFQEFVKLPYVSLKKAPVYATLLLLVISIIGLALPAQGATGDRTQIKETIQENANKAQQHQTQMSKELATDTPTVVEIDPSAELDVRYDLSKDQVKAAANLTITGFGDSVMLAVAPELQELFPKMYISADVGRQLYSSMEELQTLVNEGKVADTVLVGLGTNGSWTRSQLDQFMSILGSDRQIFWVNAHVPTRRWQNTVNSDLQNAAKDYPNLHIINWFDASNNQTSWFYSDQVHPNEKGAPYYVKTAAHEILTKEIVAKVQKQMEEATKETTPPPTQTTETTPASTQDSSQG